MTDLKSNIGFKQEPQQGKIEWEGPEFEAALAHLERLQEQLDSLRAPISSVVAPLLRQHQANITTHKTKAQLFAEIQKAAVQSTEDLKDFRQLWGGERTQEILRMAKESVERDEEMGPAAEVGAWGWSSGEGK